MKRKAILQNLITKGRRGNNLISLERRKKGRLQGIGGSSHGNLNHLDSLVKREEGSPFPGQTSDSAEKGKDWGISSTLYRKGKAQEKSSRSGSRKRGSLIVVVGGIFFVCWGGGKEKRDPRKKSPTSVGKGKKTIEELASITPAEKTPAARVRGGSSSQKYL